MTQTWGQTPQQPAAPPKKSRAGRIILLVIGGLALLLIVAVVSSGGEPTPPPAATEAQHSGIAKGAGSKDAAADVRLVSFKAVSGYGAVYQGVLEIVNHSDDTSDYYIELAIEDKDGTNVGFTNAVANKIRPGQKARQKFDVFEPDAHKVVITEIQRTASS